MRKGTRKEAREEELSLESTVSKKKSWEQTTKNENVSFSPSKEKHENAFILCGKRYFLMPLPKKYKGSAEDKNQKAKNCRLNGSKKLMQGKQKYRLFHKVLPKRRKRILKETEPTKEFILFYYVREETVCLTV